jgi:hypothetical protein
MLTPYRMKILFFILVLSVGVILVTVVALWWRLRWHMHRPNDALKNALAEIQPEQESIEKT